MSRSRRNKHRRRHPPTPQMLAHGFTKPTIRRGFSSLTVGRMDVGRKSIRLHVARTPRGYILWQFEPGSRPALDGWLYSHRLTWAQVVAAVTAAKLTA